MRVERVFSSGGNLQNKDYISKKKYLQYGAECKDS